MGQRVPLQLGKSSVPWSPRACDPHLSWSTKIALPLFARVGGSWWGLCTSCEFS
jgi:hypothetical protein